MGDVAGYDQGAFDIESGLNRVFGQFGTHGVHSLVEVDFDRRSQPRSLGGQETRRILFELFEEDALFGDFCLDVAVGRTAHADPHGARSRMARQADHPHVMYQVFAAELRSDARFLADFPNLFLPFEVAERTAPFVAAGGQMIVIVGRGFFDRGEVGFRRSTADHHREVVRRAGRGAEVFDLVLDEIRQRFVVQQGFGLLVEERFVGRTASLGQEQEFVFAALSGIEVDLRGEVGGAVFSSVIVKGTTCE